MATDTPPQAQAPEKSVPAGFSPYHLTARQFLKMIEAGVFPAGHNVELIGGLLVEQMTKFAPHTFATARLGGLLTTALPAGWVVQQEAGMALGRSWRPEPDLAVTRGPWDLYRARSPRASEIALLVEVADSSSRLDRGPKWRRYAACRIPTYWIVHLAERRVEVYSDPQGRGKAAGYRAVALHDARGSIPLIMERVEVGRIAVAEILP